MGETYLIGRRGSPHVHDYREFLERNHVAHRWIDVERNPLVRFLGASPSLGERELPLFLFPDGSVLEAPAEPEEERELARIRSDLAARVGLHSKPDSDRYDLLIVGAGLPDSPPR
jgi:thioredoxin reductase (NADPH)